MNYTNSSLATDKVNFGTKNSNPRNQCYGDICFNISGAITKIVPHHMAGKMTAKACAQMHYKSNGSSANYYIGNDGDICLGVDESRRAWTTGDRDCDSNAITIEVSNNTNKEPWTVSEKAYEALIKLCIDICKRNGIKQLNFTGDKNGNLVMHRYYQSTVCPGDYLASKFPEIAKRVNEALIPPTPIVCKKTTFVVQVPLENSAEAENLRKSLQLQGYEPIIVSKEE